LKIKLPIDILIIDILSVLLILSIIFIPYSIGKTILGLPFLLLFPGYVLGAVLYPRGEMDRIEHIALGFGMSVAVTALISLGLNYTSWGIRLEPVLYSIFAFIIIFSLIAFIRRRSYGHRELTTVINLKIQEIWQGSPLFKTVNIMLIVVILGTVGTVIYTIHEPNVHEKFTEFYILGINGKAEDYPSNFTLQNGKVLSVQYGSNIVLISESYGRVTLDIVNHEQQQTSYTVVMQIDGTQTNIFFQGGNVPSLGPIVLAPEQKWDQEIGIIPQHTGNNQEVVLSLYKDGGTMAYLNLHLWINVAE
jgi:uncharacterized membrane protein